MTALAAPLFRVRWTPGVGFEMQCPSCATATRGSSYWPLTLEFWNPNYGLRRCLACVHIERRKLRELRARRDPDDVRRRWYQTNRVRICARRRERRAQMTDEQWAHERARAAAWRERNRERLRLYNRLWRADRKRLAAA